MVESGPDIRSHPGSYVRELVRIKLSGGGGQERIEEKEERQLWSCWFEESAGMRAQK